MMVNAEHNLKSETGNPKLEIEIAGVRFNNPVWTASGTCGYGLDMAGLIDLNSLGGICTKGLSAKPMRGNAPWRIVETHGGMLNAIGLQNIGARAFVAEKLPELRKYKTRIIPNVFGYTIEEYIEAIQLLEDGEGIHAYELNISCPNVKAGGESFANDARQAAAVTEAVKRATSRPVIVKMSPNVTDIAAIARAVETAGADALSLINTAVGMAIDIHTRRPRLANFTGGLSGPAIKPIAVRCVFQASRAVRIPLVGIGGIATTEDALEFIIAGASAVQVGTANFYDPAASMKIVDGLAEYCEQNGLESIGELVGTVVTTR
ncbi:MAG TPA: dihydroorotate dehydrogenase [Blastocatellia bacterium]|nr:dihydroorotate dehydrogenase [Blastocatellia bacterium]HMV83358.1 dihydroorotate dehydrogenase [Blastocatellia bacterium]HMX29082.1 dihydroorotate dehydrogenase [Blastocatellia bacterium]HMY75350.1 dihydroorotate dehydrogenase [Blastocatellia bacterium]HMZ21970.1 dihydroorotate dehydrogenase [Blastocatellia bacterium]